eukprot:TRINITY_DN623_c0_g1_i3.p1 TRINITY_DN623_c0_g1~~TRINITY_DN623_c0_g1_i3.p1  ORF type:complete len:343 (-),score=78.04 TRINITY_DN623_c0_g1_i3:587-1615(-)
MSSTRSKSVGPTRSRIDPDLESASAPGASAPQALGVSASFGVPSVASPSAQAAPTMDGSVPAFSAPPFVAAAPVVVPVVVSASATPFFGSTASTPASGQLVAGVVPTTATPIAATPIAAATIAAAPIAAGVVLPSAAAPAPAVARPQSGQRLSQAAAAAAQQRAAAAAQRPAQQPQQAPVRAQPPQDRQEPDDDIQEVSDDDFSSDEGDRRGYLSSVPPADVIRHYFPRGFSPMAGFDAQPEVRDMSAFTMFVDGHADRINPPQRLMSLQLQCAYYTGRSIRFFAGKMGVVLDEALRRNEITRDFAALLQLLLLLQCTFFTCLRSLVSQVSHTCAYVCRVYP